MRRSYPTQRPRATDTASCPLRWRLFLPREWAADAFRRRRTCVPKDVGHREKWQLALDTLDELAAAAGWEAFREATWREGSRGPMTSRFLTKFVRPAGMRSRRPAQPRWPSTAGGTASCPRCGCWPNGLTARKHRSGSGCRTCPTTWRFRRPVAGQGLSLDAALSSPDPASRIT
ncbi:transposase [Streptomyces sp. NPDC007875]|uniref:transposase n=1 Tax=Streptomyces TaxID=1883 RepID=UPI0036D167F5